MDKTLIEFEDERISTFDYFCVDNLGESSRLNGHTYDKGQPTLDILSLDESFIEKLVYLGVNLYHAWNEGQKNKYTVNMFRFMRDAILTIIELIKDTAPYRYFDIAHSLKVVNEIFADGNLEQYVKLSELEYSEDKELVGKWRIMDGLVTAYIYICADTLNFKNIAYNIANITVATKSRKPSELAAITGAFFTDGEINEQIKKSNPFPFVDGISLRPHAVVIPIIAKDDEPNEFAIRQRVYFGRFMDYFVTDLFDALACGHYIWQCGYCGRYFLMTTAHKQLYCQTVAPGEKYPCAKLAKYHKTATEHTKANKQSIEDNPLHILWKKRDTAIRKHKSRGTYPEDVCERAKTYAKDCYERAMSDSIYAEQQYTADMEIENIYKNVL